MRQDTILNLLSSEMLLFPKNLFIESILKKEIAKARKEKQTVQTISEYKAKDYDSVIA